MDHLDPSMRPKVKGDTFFLPDSKGGVYFRNNVCSFRLEGKTMDQWIEKLIPMFTGEHTLGDLTAGLPELHRRRVYEIAGVLQRHGFVRDVSRDHSHRLPEKILKEYAAQIEFLDSFGGSGAHRFQSYRQTRVLAAGSGSMLVSLVAALFESGLPKIHVLVTEPLSTHCQRLTELAEHARKRDPGAALEELTLHRKGEGSWRGVVEPFDAVLYVSQNGDIEELRSLHEVCRKEGKKFLPAVCLASVGLAGPMVHPDSEGCWESAWHRLHQTVIGQDRQAGTYSSTAGAMMANIIGFELLKTALEESGSERKNQVFLLDLETLEGDWHSFLPHPRVAGTVAAKPIQDLDRLLEEAAGNRSKELLPFFGRLTSAGTGIFHIWEEGDLTQLPLSQCRVQAVDPLSDGPAGLLPEIICAGLTHEEVRREAGLAGIEAYVSGVGAEKVRVKPGEYVGIGAGETAAEAICRGLQKCLAEELGEGEKDGKRSVFSVRLSAVEDRRCRFYLKALTTMQGEPKIGRGEDVSGFPVIWVGTGGEWVGQVGLTVTLALRQALLQALTEAQNAPARSTKEVSEALSIREEKSPQSLAIPSCGEVNPSDVLQSARSVLKRNRKQLLAFDLAQEPFLKEELAGVFGVVLREEDFR